MAKKHLEADPVVVPNAVLVENPGGEPYEASADDPVNPEGQTLFVNIGRRRYEHCATTADGRWVYRAS